MVATSKPQASQQAPSVQAVSERPATTREQMDAALARLHKGKEEFQGLGPVQRIALLDEAMKTVRSVAEDWVRAACDAKGIDFASATSGEEWLSGPSLVIRNIRLLKESLQGVIDTGAPPMPPGGMKTRPNGQVSVQVFPTNVLEKALFAGFSADAWMEPGLTEEDVQAQTGWIYREDTPASVELVLAAGNVASIGPMDVLYKMFAENRVVLLKMNPVNDYLGPILERGFATWVERGLLQVVYGGAEVGAYLCSHEKVDSIHITGSHHTHDAIVWGPPGPERSRRMEEDDPVCTKPITSELGCVTPIVVVPGPWTESDLAYHGQNIGTMVANNASFNCNAGKLLVTSESWAQRQPLLSAIEGVLRGLPPRPAYYPGAHERYASFMEAHPDGKKVGREGEGTVPWTLFTDLAAAQEDEICFHTEAFCGVLGEVGLPESDPVAFLREAVRFCNERVWGTLSCVLMVHPKTEKSPAFQAALEQALVDLRYGGIAINVWSGLCYGLVSTPWGAYPGHTNKEIVSGRGVVHNTYLLRSTQKSVVRAPFRISPKPAFFCTHKRSHLVGQAICEFEAEPGLKKMPRVIWHAAQG